MSDILIKQMQNYEAGCSSQRLKCDNGGHGDHYDGTSYSDTYK